MHRARLSLLMTVLLGFVLFAGEKQPQPTREQIARWVTQLGDNDFIVREEATQKLWQAGEPAEAALKEAVKSTDAEVMRRAKDLLEKFKWGIYPSTPKAVVELIGRYQREQGNEKTDAIRDLLDAGPVGCKALVKIVAAEDTPEARKAVQDRIALELPRSVPGLLAQKDFARLETLLNASMEGDNQAGLRNAAAYWLLRGQIDQKIAHYTALAAKEEKDKTNVELLVSLHRAKGNLIGAREAARRAGRDDLVEAMFLEVGDWTGAAWPEGLPGEARKIDQLCYRAACKRLTGTPKQFEEVLAELRKTADDLKPEDHASQLHIAKAFLRNHSPKEALAILGKSNENTIPIFEILEAQNKYTEALALVEKARLAMAKITDEAEKKAAETAFAQLEVHQARILGIVGEKEKARAIFAGLRKLENFSDEVLVEAEMKAGLVDEAFDRAARFQIRSPRDSNPLLGTLFLHRGETAAKLLNVFNALHPLDNAFTNLKRLRGAMEGKASRQDLGRWIDNAEASIKNLEAEEAERWRLALAEAALLARQDDLARRCLEKGSGAKVLLRLGDVLAGKKEWERAAERYYQAWEKDRQQALPLYLSGKALVRAGRDKEGQQRMEHAHMMPLGNEDVRRVFVYDLIARRDNKALAREADLLFRLSQPSSWTSGNATLAIGIHASQRHDLVQAGDYLERHLIARHGRGFADFVNLPAFTGKLEAASLLDAGKINEALAVVSRCQDMRLGYENLPTMVVPRLEKLGRKKEADEIFDKSYGFCANLCKEYPRCALAHNALAWIAAGCGRNLDAALEHAQNAIRLDPDNPDYYDTLAEVYLKTGQQKKALETIRKAVALAPFQAYYRRALKRIEAGDPKAPLLSDIIYGGPQLSMLLTNDDS